MAKGDDFERRLVVSVDVKGYGGQTANWQGRIQTDLIGVLDRAAERAGLDRATWARQAAGDGELAVLPPTEPEPRVVDDFPRHLVAELRRYNRDVPGDRRMRLRLALDYGPAIVGANGFTGAAPVIAGRLCDSKPVRTALDVTGAALAVILSKRVYSETVAQEHTSLDATMFRKVAVSVKDFVEDAWVWVPDHHIRDEDLPDDPAPAPPVGPPSGPPASQQIYHGNFNGATVHADKVVGGDSLGQR
ncbi:hypothetical protein [Acrocarpospora sp. B8E8]|uniref:hypothetical protein n=1 Tax=Acrocarpospora sp. B8E8 TaxID=3153572 RepID=UPI00325E0ADB